MTSLTRYTLRAAMIQDADPADNLRILNRALMARYTGDDPATAPPWPASSNGWGHPDRPARLRRPSPALVLRADGTAEFLSTRGGMLVGVLAAAQFVEVRTVLRPGDTLLLYTDGLTEARVGPGRNSTATKPCWSSPPRAPPRAAARSSTPSPACCATSATASTTTPRSSRSASPPPLILLPSISFTERTERPP